MVDTSEPEGAAEEVEAAAGEKMMKEKMSGEKMIKMEVMITEVMMTEMMILTVETAEEMETTAALMRRETAPMMTSYHFHFSHIHDPHYQEFNICCQEHFIRG